MQEAFDQNNGRIALAPPQLITTEKYFMRTALTRDQSMEADIFSINEGFETST
jgi:hypothetical protein